MTASGASTAVYGAPMGFRPGDGPGGQCWYAGTFGSPPGSDGILGMLDWGSGYFVPTFRKGWAGLQRCGANTAYAQGALCNERLAKSLSLTSDIRFAPFYRADTARSYNYNLRPSGPQRCTRRHFPAPRTASSRAPDRHRNLPPAHDQGTRSPACLPLPKNAPASPAHAANAGAAGEKDSASHPTPLRQRRLHARAPGPRPARRADVSSSP